MLKQLSREWAFLSASTLAQHIRMREIGCADLLDFYLERVKTYNPKLNCIVSLDLETAKARAREADDAIERGEIWGPLHGVPMTIKDTFDVAGLATTWGAPELRGNLTSRDAAIVGRFRAAGAIIFGKTNVPPYAAGWQTSNPIFGASANPWNVQHTPGGSSGGAASAIAAGLCALEAGSDISGSLRNPAHYCGIYSHRPTQGIVSLEGHDLPGVGPLPDLAVTGPLARSAEDLELAMGLMPGPAAEDAVAWSINLPDPAPKPCRDYRIAVLMRNDVVDVDTKVQTVILDCVEKLKSAGVRVTLDVGPAIDQKIAHGIFSKLANAAVSALTTERIFKGLARFAILMSGSDSHFGRLVKDIGMRHRDWIALDLQRRLLRQAWAEFFTQYDLLLCPAASTTAPVLTRQAFSYNRKITINGRQVLELDQYFWAGLASGPGLPATTVPIGLADNGLPVGIQIIGPRYADRTCLGFAKFMADHVYRFAAPPDMT